MISSLTLMFDLIPLEGRQDWKNDYQHIVLHSIMIIDI